MFINQNEKQFVILHPTKNPKKKLKKKKNWEGLGTSKIKASCSSLEPDVITRKQFSQRLSWSFRTSNKPVERDKEVFPTTFLGLKRTSDYQQQCIKKRAFFCLVDDIWPYWVKELLSSWAIFQLRSIIHHLLSHLLCGYNLIEAGCWSQGAKIRTLLDHRGQERLCRVLISSQSG